MKIKVEELMEEIKCMMQDEFEAEITLSKNRLRLIFRNGQAYSVEVKEVS